MAKGASSPAGPRKRVITTITIPRELKESGQVEERWRQLGYKSFNQYMVALLEIDLTEMPDHVVVRKSSRPPPTQKNIRFLRVPPGEVPPDQEGDAGA
jgi:hypothetical protein